MRELRLPGDDIADRVELRLVGFHEAVRVDKAALDFRFRLLDADIFGERAAANRDQNFFRADRLRLAGFIGERDRCALAVLLDRRNLRACFDTNSLLLEGFLQIGGNFLILEWHRARQHLENRHFAPKSPENRRELDANSSSADYHERLGNRLHAQDFTVGHDRRAIRVNAGKRTRFRTGREHGVRGFELGGFAVLLDGDAPRAGDAAPPGNRLDFVFAEKQRDAARVLLHHFIFARHHRGPVDLHVFYFKAEFLGALEVIVDIGVMQKNLCRNATDVQAGPAEKRVFFDHRSLQSPLRGANRGNVSARTAPDDHKIIFGQASPPYFLSFPDASRSWLLKLLDARDLRKSAAPEGSPRARLAAAGDHRSRRSSGSSKSAIVTAARGRRNMTALSESY